MKMSINDITLIPIFAIILFVQEELLVYIPNVNLTIFLIVLYSKKLGILHSSIIIVVYCILDNIFMNSFNLIYTPFMFAGWLIIPLLINTIFIKIDNVRTLALLGALFSLIYCWLFIIPNVLILKVNFIAYLTSDIVFEILLAASSYLSILWLYEPCSKAIDVNLKMSRK